MAGFLTKRAWDRRILHVDLGPALREGDTPSLVESVTVEGDPMVTVTDVSLEGAVVSFLAAGGTPATVSALVIRFQVASSPAQRCETRIGIMVR